MARGKRTKRDVYEMLTIPSRYSYCSGVIVSPHGLYLANIEFRNNYNKRNECLIDQETIEIKNDALE